MIKRSSVARKVVLTGLLSVALGFGVVRVPTYAQSAKTAATASSAVAPGVLKPADLTSLFPPQVFYRGQSASVQIRNSGGVRYGDGFLTMVALVDTSGYSTGVQQRYQAYLLTEVALRIGGRTLQPGAYGVGFVENSQFLVMDIGDHELMRAQSSQDTSLHRPTPLQVAEATEKGSYRLYAGRRYISFERAK